MKNRLASLILLRGLLLLLSFVGLFSLVQCGDDAPPLEAVRSELLVARTDAQGRVVSLLTDDGITLNLANASQRWRADTTYRVLASYRVLNESSEDRTPTRSRVAMASPTELQKAVWVYQLIRVPTAPPIELQAKDLRTDPVRLIALWQSGGYLNLRFGLPRSFHGRHAVGWAMGGIEDRVGGHRLLRLTLYHNANGDRNDYVEEAYLSCPLRTFSPWLQTGRDSIALTISTTQGAQTIVLPY